MTDFIISDEMLQQEVYNGRIPLSVAETIRSRPLSSALKAERERIYKILESKSVEYHGAPVIHYSEIEDIFLRSEQP